MNFLIKMEWSFIFYQRCWDVLHCIFPWLPSFSHSWGFLFLRMRPFFIWRRKLKKWDFYMDYFTMFVVCASHCVFTSPLARVSRVCSVHSHILNDAAANLHGWHLNWGSLFFREHRYSALYTHTKPQSLGGKTHTHTLNSGCKAFASCVVAVVDFVFVPCVWSQSMRRCLFPHPVFS